jgi:hypothetical protein
MHGRKKRRKRRRRRRQRRLNRRMSRVDGTRSYQARAAALLDVANQVDSAPPAASGAVLGLAALAGGAWLLLAQ